jgi:ATPase family associated with various cellular activities (AAA)
MESPACVLTRFAATITTSLLIGSGRSSNPLLEGAIPSVVFVEDSRRDEEKNATLDALQAAATAAVPGAVSKVLECAPLPFSEVRQAGKEVETASEVEWTPCFCHKQLHERAQKLLSCQPWFRDAHEVVGLARAGQKPCLFIAKDVDLLIDFAPSASEDKDTAPLCPQEAFALLVSMWFCRQCKAAAVDTDKDSDEEDGDEDADEEEDDESQQQHANLFVIAIGISAEYLNSKLFRFPAQALAGMSSLDADKVEEWVSDRFKKADEGSAAAPDTSPAAALPHLQSAVTLSKPPFRLTLAKDVAELTKKAETEGASASDKLPLRITFDLAVRFLPDPSKEKPPKVITITEEEKKQVLDGEKTVDEVIAAAEKRKAAASDSKGSSAKEDAKAPLASAGKAPAKAPPTSSVPPPSYIEQALVGADKGSADSLKREILTSVVLPVLAWTYLRNKAVKGSRAVPYAGADDHSPLAQQILQMADAMTKLRVKPPSGILLYGSSSSVDKNLLGEGVAQAGRMRMIVVDAALIPSKYVGDSEATIRELFKGARQASPCCLVFRNIDIIGGSRATSSSSGVAGASSIHDRMLATLLTEMDGVGIKTSEGKSLAVSAGAVASGIPADVDSPLVLVVGITEKKNSIDAALLRPGRLDRHFDCSLPAAGDGGGGSGGGVVAMAEKAEPK